MNLPFFYLRTVKFLSVFFLLLLCVFASAQDEPVKQDFDPKQEIVHDGKRYRVWNNYLTFGGMPGGSINTNIPTSQFGGALDLNFHIKTQYFQTGILMSGNVFGDYNNTQLHACWGKRIEKIHYNFAVYGGAEYALFYTWAADSVPARFIAPAKSAIGAYAVVQNYWKFKYDVGIGASVYASYNTYRTLYGIRLELFFSTAYRGLKGKRRAD